MKIYRIVGAMKFESGVRNIGSNLLSGAHDCCKPAQLDFGNAHVFIPDSRPTLPQQSLDKTRSDGL